MGQLSPTSSRRTRRPHRLFVLPIAFADGFLSTPSSSTGRDVAGSATGARLDARPRAATGRRVRRESAMTKVALVSFSRKFARAGKPATGSNAREWICGIANFGAWVTEGSETFQPLCVIWMTAAGRPLCCQPVPPDRIREKAVESFYTALREDARERPSRVRVRVSEVHLALSLGLPPDIDVVLTGTPELDPIINTLAGYLPDAGVLADAHPGGQAIEVPTFYQVSAQLFNMRPWHWLTEDDVLTLSSPELGLPWAGVVVSGNYHAKGPGLIVFTSRHDAGVYPSRKRHGPPWNGPIPFHYGILFCDVRRAPKFDPSAIRKLTELGWDASSNRVPAPVAFGPGELRPITLDEHVGLSYVQFAFATMFSDPPANAKVIGDLFTCRLLLRHEKAIPTWVNLSVPVKALERLRAAHVEAPG